MIRRPPRSTLFLHDALPISRAYAIVAIDIRNVIWPRIFFDPSIIENRRAIDALPIHGYRKLANIRGGRIHCPRSEEHTSELQSHSDLVCRLLLEKKKKKQKR